MEPWSYQQPPPPSLNGGWYTGAPFVEGAPWRNVPVMPDVSYMIHTNLLSANPPPGATQQYPGSFRPGNNAQSMAGVAPYGASNSMMCTLPVTSSGGEQPARFAKYAYLS